MTSISPDQKNTLNRFVRAWDRRLRVQQAIRWLALSMIPGLVTGLVLAGISRFRPFLTGDQILNITLLGVGAGVLALVIGVIFYPRSVMRAAQRFDLDFGLGERISTALELAEGRIRTNEQIARLQLEDAIQRAGRVRAADYLPVRARWSDWAVAALLAVALGALLFLPNPMEQNISAAPPPNPAVEEAADTLRDITEEIAADPALDEDERNSLLEELEDSIDTLERDDITTEEAFAELSDVASELQDRADALGEQQAQQQQALAGAQQALNGAFPEGEQANESDLNGNVDEMNDQLDQISELGENSQNPGATADALNEAADALEQTNPQAAQALRDAAEALQNGDTQAAQEALEEAQDALEQQQQQGNQQSETQQNLQQGADDARQQQQNLQQGSQQQGNQQQGGQQQQGDQQPGQEGGQFMLATPQAGENADQAQMGTNEGDGQQQGDQQQGAQSGGQQGGQQDSGQQTQGNAGQSQAGVAGGANAGAGDQDTGAVEQGFRSNGQVETNNNPDGEGVEEFDPVYAPQRVGGEDGPSLSLESEDGSSPLVEGDFSENPTGETTVPYNEVFSDYQGEAAQALESDYIPLGMRDVVRDYFTSIEPGQ